jgi:predicted permease
MDSFLQDIRYALRTLAAKPGFTAAALLTLALGIGANTAIFSVINGFYLKPLPYPDSEYLVDVHNHYPGVIENAGSSIPDFLDRQARAPALESLALYTFGSYNMAADGRPDRVVGLRATPSLFPTLRVQPVLGRAFTDDDAVIGREKVVVLTHATWQNQFGGDAGVIGREVRFNGEPWTIIGVMPEGFAFPSRNVAMLMPFAFTEDQRGDFERGREFSGSIGRLKPGATIQQLDAQMDAIVLENADRIAAIGGARAQGFADFLRGKNFTGRAQNYHEMLVGELKDTVLILQGVVALVLLIACANVANLMLTRVIARNRELAIRTAIGADRWRLARQLLTEAMVLALGGAALGVLFAVWGIDLIVWLGLDQSANGFDVGIDARVLMFALGLAVLTGAISGLVPVVSLARVNANEVIKEGGRGNTGGKAAAAVRNSLVVVEMAMAVTLLVGAGLLIKSFAKLQDQDPGFQAEGVVTARLTLPANRFADDTARVQFADRMLERLRAIPGVEKVGVTQVLPFTGNGSQSSYNIVGQVVPNGQNGPHGHYRVVDEDYFAAMGIRMLAGRSFDRGLDQPRPLPPRDDQGNIVDVAQQPTIAVVIDKLLADKYFKGKDPIGQKLINGWVGEVVGVVDTVKNGQLQSDVTKETHYWYYRQRPDTGLNLVLRTSLDPDSISQQVRTAILAIDPEQPVFDIQTMDQRVTASLATQKAPMVLLAVFALVAIVLAAIGIYGVLAYAVSQRTPEIGVRMAMGASRTDVFQMVIGQGARLAALGVATGVLSAFALSRLMQSMLFGVEAADPSVFVVVSLVLAAVALFACWMPARRATAVDPLVALRYE